MTSTVHELWRTRPKAIAFGVVTICSVVSASLTYPGTGVAADDDRIRVTIEVLENFPPVRVGVEKLELLQNLERSKISEFDEWLFGADSEFIRQMIDAQIDRTICKYLSSYDVSDDQEKKLVLAALADKVRFFKRVEDLRTRYEDPRWATPAKGQELLIERQELLKKQKSVLDGDSFFQKAATRILAGRPSLIYRNLDRHLSNIESAVREVNRQVSLRKSQREALFRLIVRVARPPKADGDFDDLLVKYRMTLVPEERLRPLFDDDDQFLKVLHAIDGFREFGSVLAEHGLIEVQRGQESDIVKPADAFVPDPSIDAKTPVLPGER